MKIRGKREEGRGKQLQKMTMIVLALTTLFSISSAPAFAQEAPKETVVIPTAPAEQAGQSRLGFLSVGEDNIFYTNFKKGDKKSSGVAVGAGTDIVQYAKKFQYGGELDLRGRATIAEKVTGGQTGILFSAAVTVDAVKLLTGSKITILIPNLALKLGIGGGYDIAKGSAVAVGNVMVNYDF